MKRAQKKIAARKASKSYITKQQFLKKKREEAKPAVKKLQGVPESLAKRRKAYKESFAKKQLRRLVEKKIPKTGAQDCFRPGGSICARIRCFSLV